MISEISRTDVSNVDGEVRNEIDLSRLEDGDVIEYRSGKSVYQLIREGVTNEGQARFKRKKIAGEVPQSDTYIFLDGKKSLLKVVQRFEYRVGGNDTGTESSPGVTGVIDEIRVVKK